MHFISCCTHIILSIIYHTATAGVHINVRKLWKRYALFGFIMFYHVWWYIIQWFVILKTDLYYTSLHVKCKNSGKGENKMMSFAKLTISHTSIIVKEIERKMKT